MNLVDLDLEAIELDGGWFTREQLVSRIKSMLDAGDHRVSTLAGALEQLASTLADLRTMAVRMTPQLANAISEAASRQVKTEAAVIREALMIHLGVSDAVSAPPAVVAPAQTPKSPSAFRTTKPAAGAAVRPQ